jgi:hypothetical protein
MEKKDRIGYFFGTKIYNTYEYKPELQSLFEHAIIRHMMFMDKNEDVYVLQFMFDGDEVSIRRTEEHFKIEKVRYFTIS